MLEVWLGVLDVLDRLMGSGGQQQQLQGQGGRRGERRGMGVDDGGLEEQIPESLKNILLVMGGAGYLVPPEEGIAGKEEGKEEEGGNDNERIWTETKKRVQRFLPGLFDEVFPPPQQQMQMQQQTREGEEKERK